MEKDIVEEGKVKIYLKANLNLDNKYKNGLKDVFYNPVQVFNRDLSLLVSLVFTKGYKEKLEAKGKEYKGIRFYDALTASGLRALRFRKEFPEELIDKVIGCDMSELAIQIFKKNLKLNNLENDEKIEPILKDSNQHMFSIEESEKFHIIDLDPYGSMVPFLYAAIKAIKKGGLLCVTCTDTRVLCGSDKHKCFYLYRSSRGYSHTIEETALRIALQTINTVANFHGKNIKVLLSVQSDFYVRLFVEVIQSRKECWKSINQIGL